MIPSTAFNGGKKNLLGLASCEESGPATRPFSLAKYYVRIDIGMVLLKMGPILVGTTTLGITTDAQTGFVTFVAVLLLAMSIKALSLYKFCVAIIAEEQTLRNTGFVNVSGR
jgi:hypothetical protein